jgi:hypothetical protein
VTRRKRITKHVTVALAAASVLFVLLSPSLAHARGCREVSDIVGEQKCTRYGQTWGIERQFPLTSYFGMRYSELSTANATFDEVTKKQSRPDGYHAYSYPGEALGVKSLSGIGIEGGFGLFLYGQLYMKFEGAVTWGTASTASFTASNGVKLSKDTGINVNLLQGGVPIGYRIPLGRAALRGELMLGAATATVDHHVDAQGLPTTGSASSTRFLVEPRLAGEIWFSQHISFGGYFGMNVLDTDWRSRGFGLSLTWHNRSFDGDSSF